MGVDTETDTMNADLILILNQSGPGLPINRNRAAEIAAEIDQFHQAAEVARKRTEFNVDVSDFRRALEELADGSR